MTIKTKEDLLRVTADFSVREAKELLEHITYHLWGNVTNIGWREMRDLKRALEDGANRHESEKRSAWARANEEMRQQRLAEEAEREEQRKKDELLEEATRLAPALKELGLLGDASDEIEALVKSNAAKFGGE
nr:hypothetical protein 14 [Gammaproteobacteria bacterium]